MKIRKSKKRMRVYTFTNTILQLLKEESIEFALAVQQALDFYLKNWTKVGPARSLVISAERARKLNIIADVKLAEAKDRDGTSRHISCRAGCAHCCKVNVGITPMEADLLILMKPPDAEGIERLKRQQGHEGVEPWIEQPIEDRACVYLGPENQCTVYPHRPMACRKYFVLTPAERCETGHPEANNVLSWFDTDVEILSTAAMTHFGMGSMPSMLLAAMERRKHESEKTQGL